MASRYEGSRDVRSGTSKKRSSKKSSTFLPVVVVPKRLRLTGGREQIETIHPTTGDRLDIYIDEISRFEVVE